MTEALRGVTHVCYGPFEALLAGLLEDSEKHRPVWKVWYGSDDDRKLRLADKLTKIEAVTLAQDAADAWRKEGKPDLSDAAVKKLVAKLR